jgi:hypothetical protein
MLDHPAIVFMSDNGEQHHSTGTEWPALLIGGNALGLKTDGRRVIFPADGAANDRQSPTCSTPSATPAAIRASTSSARKAPRASRRGRSTSCSAEPAADSGTPPMFAIFAAPPHTQAE